MDVQHIILYLILIYIYNVYNSDMHPMKFIDFKDS